MESGPNIPGSARGGRNRRRYRGAATRGRVSNSDARQANQSSNSRTRRGTRQDSGLLMRASAGTRGRRFQGHLSENTDEHATILQADAPEFTPGQPLREYPIRNTATQQRESLLSVAPDIATQTHENIQNGLYECLICMNEVLTSSKIWSCKTCWKVFHLSCIKKWSYNEGCAPSQPREADGTSVIRQWRCPGCNLPKEDMPSSYTCWCGKESDPRSLAGLPPHSCGQTCGKSRAAPVGCPHACSQICHAGPCLPCSHMGPEQICYCGKSSSQRRCIETNYVEGWNCEKICGDRMPCGIHSCPRKCHSGLCGACEVTINGRCFCGKIAKQIVCKDKEGEKLSELSTLEGMDTWTGYFDCFELCGRALDCGHHKCTKTCHAQDLDIAHCPMAADMVTHCPCGKTSLSSLGYDRKSCLDPIPSCPKECSKELPCGHACKSKCHSGLCLPCSQRMSITCRCGRVTSNTACHQGIVEPPLCTRICKSSLNCGRHDCGEHCCPGERRATERLASKRKLRPFGASGRMLDEEVEAEHICTRTCGKMLKCGNHTCSRTCHKGPCGTCQEAIFHELSCHCGKTILFPPLPCGTKAPPCRFDCERAKQCGHPQVQHNCHGDEDECPKCPFLVEKACMCGKKTLKNQKCGLSEARCGEICGKQLRCGSHRCRLPCHRPGECEDSERHCQQACGKEKRSCSHPCSDRCHAPSACKDDKPCQSKVLITCECQHLKTETKCLASRNGQGNLKKTLKCDDECGRLQRNNQLALALNIDPANHTDDHIPYSVQTLSLYQDYLKWAQTQENEMRIFAADDSSKRLRFKPMPAHYRSFIHSLAEDFGFDSESLDPEPHRHVVIFKTPKFVKAPMKTLADCVRIRAAIVTTSSSTSASGPRLTAPNDLFNGFVLSSIRFGLTIDELRGELSNAFAAASTLAFDIAFLPSEEIVLKAKPSSSTTTIAPLALESAVKSIKSNLFAAVTTKKLAGSMQLCSLDSSLNILRKENEKLSGQSGWSQVAAKAASPKVLPKPEGWGSKSSFTVLGRKKKLEETKKIEDVVDDWEAAMNEEEKANVTAETGTHVGTNTEDVDVENA